MVRYAEWREAIDPERPHERFDPLVRVGVAALAGIAGTACCVYGSIPASILAWRSMGDEQLRKRVARLRDLPAQHEQHACRLSLTTDGIVYGTDEGLVSFIDGSMLFEGRRTSFSVPRADADTTDLVGGGLAFRYESPGGAYQAMIEAPDTIRMAESYQRWLRQSVNVEGTIVFPPFRPERSAWRRAEALRAGAGATLILGLLVGAVASARTGWPVGLSLALAALILAYAFASSARRLRAALTHLRALPDPPKAPL